MEFSLASLPALNASLNALSAVFIAVGFAMIKGGKPVLHRRFMLAAAATSGVFLISYVIKASFHGTTVYGGTGLFRTIYLSVLFSHLTLAMAVVPLVLVTLSHGLRNRLDRHRRIARWTLPIWFYVSVTGVVIFFMLRPWY